MANETARMTFRDYYLELQARFGLAPIDVVGTWPIDAMDLVTALLQEALVAAEVVGTAHPEFAMRENGEERTNQSKGNVAADFICEALNGRIEGCKIEQVTGAGYPDRRLAIDTDQFVCCLEFKATAKWKETDGIRRVLTASPRKIVNAIMSGELPPSPCHLIATVLYDGLTGNVQGLRLDFLQPDSPVDVRLEASTSQKLLSNGPHRSVILGG